MNELLFHLTNKQATINLGKDLAQFCTSTIIIYLYGDLGAGKTTFSRGFIQKLGYKGNIKSPTYTMVECYSTTNHVIYHFDFFRIENPKELEFMGIYDYFSNHATYLIEWPQKALSMLPHPDIEISLTYQKQKHEARVKAVSMLGYSLINSLNSLK